MTRLRDAFAVVILAFAIAAGPASARPKERSQLYAEYRDLWLRQQYKDVTSARLAGRRTLADFLEQLELEKFRID